MWVCSCAEARPEYNSYSKVRASILPPSQNEAHNKAELRPIRTSFWDGGGIEGGTLEFREQCRKNRKTASKCRIFEVLVAAFCWAGIAQDLGGPNNYKHNFDVRLKYIIV